ncbi:MAG: thiamine pyrophosphate-dependent enzyme [Terracidiphilus sp.]|jgi:TPP-dependent pyruvate/acetoin dehydrogenase alpha subunit
MTTRTKEAKAAATAALAGNNGFSLISNEKLIQLYASLVRCRMITERVRTLSKQHKFDGRNGGATGWEAAMVGVVINLQPEDSVAPSRSSSLANLIKDLRLDRRVISSLLFGGATHEVPDDELAAAIELAQSNQRKQNGKIVAVFRDRDEASGKCWNEALGLADADRLPMLFVSHPTIRSAPGARAGILKSSAWSHGFPAIPVDGSDVVAVYRVATEAIAHARKGNGATLIECFTVLSNDIQETDPVLKMEAYLNRKGLFSEQLKCEVAAGFRGKLDAAVKARKRTVSA